LSGTLKYDRDVHYFYGFKGGLDDSLDQYTRELLRQRFQLIGVDLGLKNTKQTKADIDYSLNFKFNNFKRVAGDTVVKDASENYYRFDMGIGKTFQKIHSAHLDFNYQREDFQSTNDSVLNYFPILPNYQFRNKVAFLRLGVNVDVINKDVKLYPEIEASYKLIGDYLIPFAGFTGSTQPNTLKAIAAVNPFIGTLDSITSTENLEAYAGVKGSYGNNIVYNARLSYSQKTNLPFYIPDGDAPTHYSVLYYYEAKIIGFHAEVGYKQSERFNLLLSGETSSWDLDFNDEPLGIAKSKLTLSANYNIQNKIVFSADLFGQSGAYTIVPGDSLPSQRKGFMDVNFSTTYNYKENISFWFSLLNIAGVKERQWYNYPYYGFQAMAGVMLKF